MTSNHLKTLITLLPFIVSLVVLDSGAQMMSHELRRLSLSTNQFGIDALKALDRIEPPDKVLVFCPVCLSSSLMMVMMGSSKYQVVSALRHALYVWSMKPQEINRGYKRLFEHIGLNQYQLLSKGQSILPATRKIVKRSTKRMKHATISRLNEPDSSSINTQLVQRIDSDLEDFNPNFVSLPKLVKLKEELERVSRASAGSWWLARQKDLGGKSESRVKHNSTVLNMSLALDKKDSMQSNSPDLSQMSAMSSIYIQRGMAMNYNYNLLLRQFYKTVIHPVDFMRSGEETRQHINSLVAASTEGKIKDLVGNDVFGTSGSPKVMLISTFHFRGTLDIGIKSKLQDPKTPITAPKSIETVAELLKYGNFKDLGCSAVEIPFNNRLISLLIVMPNHHNQTEMLLTKLSGQVLNDIINSLEIKRLSVEIPVIKFDRGPVNVEGILKELSLAELFFGDQNYSTETGLNKWLRPRDIMHETSIDIGTTGPQVSFPEDRLKVGAHEDRSMSSEMKGRSNSKDEHLKLDKPFLYFVLDTLNGLVLTMGRIRQ